MKIKTLFNTLIFGFLIAFSNISCGQSGSVSGFVSQPQETKVIHSSYIDLTFAAEKTVNTVVHIKTEFLRKNSFWDDFFGESILKIFFGIIPSQYPVIATGSGVIIDPNGYIVTNNHVVEDANKITVTLNNKREYTASIVGADPQSDLALIKIDAHHLPYLSFGNSDHVRIGEWVLAVGNPFNLTSTVTAGIVSAKARNLNILGDKASVESFIQTDAAVNQGNSGGALVNTTGELIGINTAIASKSGYFTGYSFAIPSNIAKKIVMDLKEFGTVKRAFLGIVVIEMDSRIASEMKLNEVKGVYVTNVSSDGAAAASGIRVGDVILEINNKGLNSMSELREIMAQHSPGDKLKIRFFRKNNEYETEVVLK